MVIMEQGKTDSKEHPLRKQKESTNRALKTSPAVNQSRKRRRRPPRGKGRKDPAAQQLPPISDKSTPCDDWNPSLFKVPAREGKVRFHDFDLPDPLLHAIFDLGFEYCTPIQAEILPGTLSGKDASGRAQTGTGKTAAFLITVIERLLRHPLPAPSGATAPRVLVLAPTRELVLQITDEARHLARYCALSIVAVFGGMDYEKQRKQLRAGPIDIVVATPGRLLDFQQRRDISLKKIEVMVIDEADRMLDMGFIPDVRKIINSTPPKEKRQTLLFSATLTGAITRLASQWTRDPVEIEIEPEQIAVETVEQIIYIVTAKNKFNLLFNIIERQHLNRVLVFCNRRDEVNRLSEVLTRCGINCAVLSGEIPQRKRIQRLEDFKTGKIRVLVATDVAGRGIHIEGMSHVINFTLPTDPEDYVHRIGRTGRAGNLGTSISFADEGDSFYIPAIEKYIDRRLQCIEPEDEWLTLPEEILERKNRLQRSARKTRQTGRPL